MWSKSREHLRRGLTIILLVALVASFAGMSDARAQQLPLVAAASDLQFALEELRQRFRGERGLDFKPVLGSSGNLVRQIRSGARFELFLSADEDYARALTADGLTRDEGAVYALGLLALLVPHGSPLKADPSLADLMAALGDGRLRRLAIANPEHAPYGRRAKEALQRAGIWEEVADRLVLGENVTQAAQFATSGAAQGGLIAWSLAQSPQIARLGTAVLVPADRHAPLVQRMVLMRNASPAALRLYEFLQTPSARAIFERNGFALPGEPS